MHLDQLLCSFMFHLVCPKYSQILEVKVSLHFPISDRYFRLIIDWIKLVGQNYENGIDFLWKDSQSKIFDVDRRSLDNMSQTCGDKDF